MIKSKRSLSADETTRQSSSTRKRTGDNTMTPPNDDDATEFSFRAQAFHRAAKIVLAALECNSARQDWDIWPVVYLYRQAVEMHLKAIVFGEGGNFLPTKPDPMSISKTHSVSWLAQFVCQIVAVLKWEEEFKCEGVESLADFKAIIEDVNSVDPGYYTFRPPVDPCSQFAVHEFARKMDRLLDLLESTADALAAEWDGRGGGTGVDDGNSGSGGNWGPVTIH